MRLNQMNGACEAETQHGSDSICSDKTDFGQPITPGVSSAAQGVAEFFTAPGDTTASDLVWVAGLSKLQGGSDVSDFEHICMELTSFTFQQELRH